MSRPSKLDLSLAAGYGSECTEISRPDLERVCGAGRVCRLQCAVPADHDGSSLWRGPARAGRQAGHRCHATCLCVLAILPSGLKQHFPDVSKRRPDAVLSDIKHLVPLTNSRVK